MRTNRTSRTAILALALLGCAQVNAEALRTAGKFCFLANLGAAFTEDAVIKSSFLSPLGSKGAPIKFDPGARLDVGMGYRITEWFAIEAETGFTLNVAKDVGSNRSDDYAFYQVPVMGNAVLNIPTRTRFHPFLGLGAGGVFTTLEKSDFFYSRSRSDEDFGFAWQGFAGVRYPISRSVELGVVYKYLSTTERDFDSFSATLEGIATHSVAASLSMRF